MRGLDVVGVDYGGLVSSIFNTGSAALDVAQQSQAEKAADAKLQAAIAADHAATIAVWKANASAAAAATSPSAASTAKADKIAADQAVKVQDKAGAAVAENLRPQRVKAAQDFVDNANQDMQDALRSGDKSKQMSAQAELDAARQTLAKAQGVAPEGNTGTAKPKGGSLLSKKVVGPIKVWEVLGALVAVVGGAIVWKHRK